MDGWKTYFPFVMAYFQRPFRCFREGTWNETGVWCKIDSQFESAGQQAWQPLLGFRLQLPPPVWFLFQGPIENSTLEVGIIWGITQDNARKESSCLIGWLYLGVIEGLPGFKIPNVGGQGCKVEKTQTEEAYAFMAFGVCFPVFYTDIIARDQWQTSRRQRTLIILRLI